MKEIISAVIFIVGISGSVGVLISIHQTVKVAALEKTKKGLPSLTEISGSFRKSKK